MTSADEAHLTPVVATASPAGLLVMLYEQLVLDVQRGLDAQRRGDLQETRRQLSHAEEIVLELQNGLRADQFKGGYDLSALYSFLHRQLVLASVGKDTTLTDEVLTMVTDLCETWHRAALESVSGSARSA